MPVAAAPRYLGQDFTDASPGSRFGMFLKLWGVNRRTGALLWNKQDIGYEVRGQERREREVAYDNKAPAIREASRLTARDKATWQGLVERQRAAFAAYTSNGGGFEIRAAAIAPFTTGLGNEHPLENGFAFLNPYGLPYLPGSGVKGVVRRAAQELAKGMWENGPGWAGFDKQCYRLEVRRGKETIHVDLSVVDVLFGLESGSGEIEHVRGALAFWDVIPQINGNSLMVEIMTPHQSHYYQQKRERKSGDSTTPHDSGQPTPICFLTVPPGSGFAFHVVCDTAHLARITRNKREGAPDLLAIADGRPLWHTLLASAFEHAFEWLGFGAKTAVGYGAMRNAASKAAGSREPQKVGSDTPAAQTLVWQTAKLLWNRGRQELSASSGRERTAGVKGVERARALFADPAIFERVRNKGEHGPVRVEVTKEGNYIVLKRVL